jgi:hypothetical protein
MMNFCRIPVVDDGRRQRRGHPGLLIRRSDEIFRIRQGIAILMSETSKIAALKAVERYSNACLGQYALRFAVASFPGDGHLTGTVLNAAFRRLNRARASPLGEVVYRDD